MNVVSILCRALFKVVKSSVCLVGKNESNDDIIKQSEQAMQVVRYMTVFILGIGNLMHNYFCIVSKYHIQ